MSSTPQETKPQDMTFGYAEVLVMIDAAWQNGFDVASWGIDPKPCSEIIQEFLDNQKD